MSEFRLPTADFDFSTVHMARALELAQRGQGYVEPNPMVGCVIIDDAGQPVGEGFHTRYGAPHAEVEALRVAGARARGATMFVTLEPCCHHGKTPPCTQAIIAAGIQRVIAAMRDPFPQVCGSGLAALHAAGIEVFVGLHEEESRDLNAPYLKLLEQGQPWIIAKWAMTLDGKLATRTGNSQWISSEFARAIGHQLRGRMDALIVGKGTAIADNPLLTARPGGARVATRIVVDSTGSLDSNSPLVLTAKTAPVLIAVAVNAPATNIARLQTAGCEVLVCPGETPADRLSFLLAELGRRRCTNVLVEGGSQLLGSLFDLKAIDEVHAFVAPKLVGGSAAPSPMGGLGIDQMHNAIHLVDPKMQIIGGDWYVQGRIKQASSSAIGPIS